MCNFSLPTRRSTLPEPRSCKLSSLLMSTKPFYLAYFKGFELLRKYLTKHNPSINLEGLDFEAVDKEMEVDEAAEVVVVAPIEGNVPEADGDAPEPMVGDDAA